MLGVYFNSTCPPYVRKKSDTIATIFFFVEIVIWKYNYKQVKLSRRDLYQSWDETPFTTDTDWILDRLRFSLTLSGFNTRSLF